MNLAFNCVMCERDRDVGEEVERSWIETMSDANFLFLFALSKLELGVDVGILMGA